MTTPKKRIRRGAARGFTLIELVVALSAGLLVSMSALLLSRNATKFFQNEARISATQLAATLGMNRLTQDLQRASFLASRNNTTDKTLCTNGALPASLAQFLGLRIRIGGSVATHPTDLQQAMYAENAMAPDLLVIGGSMDTSERFAIEWTYTAGGQRVVELQRDGAIARLRLTASQNQQTLAQILTPIFRAGRFLRFADNGAGQGTLWGIIDGFSVVGAVGAETIAITLNNTPAIPVKTQLTTCGLTTGSNKGVLVSVVSRIQYDLRSLQGDPVYGTLVAPASGTISAITGEDLRTELVRVELDQNGDEVPGTLELVAELAANLKFGVTKAPLAGTATVFNPQMTTYGFDDPTVMTNPELVRSVQVQLSTRARVPDRENMLAASGRNYRFAVLQPPVRERFARLRTLHATVALPNQADFSP